MTLKRGENEGAAGLNPAAPIPTEIGGYFANVIRFVSLTPPARRR
jgi:hypothetical protein